MGDERRGHRVAGVLVIVVTLAAALFVGLCGLVLAGPQGDPPGSPDWPVFSLWLLLTFLVLVGGMWASWRVWSGGWSRRKGSA